MLTRMSIDKINQMAKKFPVLVITGPRQSGKTTICKQAFSNYRYVTLENPDDRAFATKDPRSFLALYDNKVIIDEAQNVPELFSYLQERVDTDNISGQYVLSGSQNFMLMEKISQTLAGRVYIFELLPLCFSEIASTTKKGLLSFIQKGGYPRIYDKKISPVDFYPSYLKTYVERDVRSVLRVQELRLFKKFLLLCANQIGQLFNAHSISRDLGIDTKTVQRWLSVLETGYIAFTLKPWHKNFSKRVIKTPKLYFYDTGLAASLLGIDSEDELSASEFKGALFENYVVLELMKHNFAKGVNKNYYFWRDSNGNEIDLVVERGVNVSLVETKFSQTVKPEFLKGLHYLDPLKGSLKLKHYLVNSADKSQSRSFEKILSWRDAGSIE